METVGIRELKTNFSRYLIRVKLGETIIITDRKKEVAVITPFGQQKDDKTLFDLMERGIAQWSGGKPKGLSPGVISKGGKVSEAVLEGRR
jgi:prevent-host-death family protein